MRNTTFGLGAETSQPLQGLSRRDHAAIASKIADLLAEMAAAGLPLVHASTDMAMLSLANLRAREMDWHPLMPTYDVRFGPISADDAFWICCADQQGEMKAAIAVRLREVQTNLKLAWLSGELLSDEPRRGIRGTLTGPLARLEQIPEMEEIRGEIAIPGAMWVHSDMRGKRLSEKLFALSVLHSYRLWKPAYFVGLVELEKEHGVGFRSYGFPRAHKFCSFEVPGAGLKAQSEDICIMTMSLSEARELYLHR